MQVGFPLTNLVILQQQQQHQKREERGRDKKA